MIAGVSMITENIYILHLIDREKVGNKKSVESLAPKLLFSDKNSTNFLLH